MEENDSEAFRWFQEAAQQEFPRAMSLLAECYENGYGVEEDIHKAVEWYQKAVAEGYPPAQCALGLCYELGTGVPEDKASAF